MLTNAPADWRHHGDLLMFGLAAAGAGSLALHPASAAGASVIQNGSAPPLPPQHQAAYAAASPGPAPDGAPGPLYKFKNNIKQRFSAEHHNGVGGPLGPGGLPYGAPKRRRYASETDDVPGAAGGNLLSLSLHRQDSETCSVPSPPASPPPVATQPHGSAGAGAPPRSPLLPSPASSPPPSKFALAGALPPPPAPPPPPARPVPIFALHSRGAYYVPLTLDAEVLAPYLATCGCDGAEPHAHASAPCGAPVALHPVTISVNFSRAPAPCLRLAARNLGACGAAAPATMGAPGPAGAAGATALSWKAEPAPWKVEPGGAFGGQHWHEALPERG